MAKKLRNKRGKRHVFLTVLNYILILLIVGGLVAAGAVYYIVKNAISDLPPIDPTRIELVENSVMYDSEGNLIEKIYEPDGLRTIISYDDISAEVINAFVAVEDKTFFEHQGFNIVRMVGAVRDALFSGKEIGGTSTLTQQLARNLYLFEIRSDRTIDRKIQEAYYTIKMEDALTKTQILEAYLNTISLGGGANGIQAAAQVYFSKDAADLDYIESAILAAVPKSPTKYAPLKVVSNKSITSEDIVVGIRDDEYSYVFNEDVVDRYLLVLSLMHQQGYITDSEYETAKELDLPSVFNPSKVKNDTISSYFSDLVKEQVVADLMTEYDYTEQQAYHVLYNEGLKIYTTLDTKLQNILETSYNEQDLTDYFGSSTDAAVRNFQYKYGLVVDGYVGTNSWNKLIELGYFTEEDTEKPTLYNGVTHDDVILLKQALLAEGLLSNSEHFPRIRVYFDENENIINEEGNSILLYKHANLIDKFGNLIIPTSDYSYDDEGNLVLLKGKRFYFSSSKRIFLKNAFKYDELDQSIYRNSDGTTNIPYLYIFEGREVLLPEEYTSFDDNGNIVVDKDLLDQNTFFMIDDEDNLLVKDEDFGISTTGVIQPQSAMVIIDHRTGHLKAIVGGRNISGQKIYNRATNPRPPGSSIKPIGVYLPAIDSRRWTAGSVVDDVPTYLDDKNPDQRWPKNWYETDGGYSYKYRGRFTLREGIEYSLNVLAATVANDIGVENIMNYLKKMGITTIVESGPQNDHNLSAMSLGGMTKGISPIEMASAYGLFPNQGVHTETITYLRVENTQGEVILEKQPLKTQVVDEQVAFIVHDMMRSGVTTGLSRTAQIMPNNQGIPVAGKTGTTSSKYDAWFVGYTPYYSASVWFGNDINLKLDQGSRIAALFWSNVMKKVHEGMEMADYTKPDGLIEVNIDIESGMLPSKLSYEDPRGSMVRKEYFIPGTEPTETDNVHIEATIDTETGLLATEFCPEDQVETRVFIQRVVPYIPEENTDEKGNPISIQDQEYVAPTEYCDVHTEDTTTPPVDEPTDLDEALLTYPDGRQVVRVPIHVTFVNGRKFILPFGTEILQDRTLVLPDNTIFNSTEYYYDSLGDPNYEAGADAPQSE